MRALTLWQPWASLVASGVKRIENRPWAPPGKYLGQRIAIHAGKHFDDPSYRKASELMDISETVPAKGDCPQGAIIGTARIIAVARSVEEAVRFSDDSTQARWFFGPYAWVLDEIVELPEPLPCRGFQGLWSPPEDIGLGGSIDEGLHLP